MKKSLNLEYFNKFLVKLQIRLKIDKELVGMSDFN